MNIFGLLSLLAVLAIAVWFLGNGIETVQQDNAPKEEVLGNTLDAAEAAADMLER